VGNAVSLVFRAKTQKEHPMENQLEIQLEH